MLSARERAQLIAAARLYYEDDLTQAEIAKRLGVSRPIVSKMLARAREVGIVHIEIRGGDEQDSDVLEQLQHKYGLTGGLVLSNSRDALEQAARYLAMETAADKNLGLGWGYLAGDIVEKMSATKLHTQEGFIYPLIGYAHFNLNGYHPDKLVRIWGDAMGRVPYYLNCPALPDSIEERDLLEATADYQVVQALWSQMDASIIFLRNFPSVPDEGTATRFGDALQKQRAVGSFLSYYFNDRGEFISGNNDYCLHISLASLRRCRKIIGVGLNVGTRALRGALATGLITHLIVSREQAQELLDN